MAKPGFPSKPSTRAVCILGVACGLGARDGRCRDGPDVLRAGDFVARLAARGLEVSWSQTLRPAAPESLPVAERLAELMDRLCGAVRREVSAGRRPVVLGGDHTCAIGAWRGMRLALQEQGPLGLIWIDAHLDAHTPQTSPSGAYHGMPLAVLLGQGGPPLVGKETPLLPQHVCVVGARDFEPEEAALLLRLGVRVFPMEEIRCRGLTEVMAEALERVSRDTAGFGISIDVDALDPREAPAVGTPAPEGIAALELAAALRGIGDNPAFLGLEIAEFNPHLDRGRATEKVILQLIESAFEIPGLTLPAIAMEREFG